MMSLAVAENIKLMNASVGTQVVYNLVTAGYEGANRISCRRRRTCQLAQIRLQPLTTIVG